MALHSALRVARECQIGAELQGNSTARVARRYGYTERGIRKMRWRREIAADLGGDEVDGEALPA